MNKSEKTIKTRRVYKRDDDVIPAYDHLFAEKEEKGNLGKDKKPKKKRKHFLAKILKVNIVPFILTALLYIVMCSPVWIMSIFTADIINITYEALAGGMTTSHWNGIIIRIAILVFLIIINVPITYLRTIIMSKMLRRTSAGLKCSVIRKLHSLSITYHKDIQSGKVQSKFLKDTDSVDSMLNFIVHSLVPSIISIVVYVTISVIRNGYVSLFFLFIIPLNIVVTFFFSKKIRVRNRTFRLNTEDMSSKLSTMLQLIMVTKSHGLEEKESENLENSIRGVKESGHKMDRTIGLLGSISPMITMSLQVICFVFCVYLAFENIIMVGDIVLFQTMFTTISNSALNLISVFPVIATGYEALNSISEIMSAKEVETNLGKVQVPDIDGELRFQHVYYKYPNTDQYVVKDFDFEVKKGQCIAVVGGSGSGKTTLMNLITGLLMPTEGDIYIDGKSIKELNLSEYRHRISVVPQNSILFSGTIKENITYGLDEYSDEDLQRVIEMANISEFLQDLPNGINTDIGEYGDKLSGGQKQRITIARALIRNPRILIFDEATSALDNISEYHVQQAISTCIKDRTTFIVAHRLSTIRNADKIIVMDGGCPIESGTYEELMNRKGAFYELKCLSDVNTKKAEEGLS